MDHRSQSTHSSHHAAPINTVSNSINQAVTVCSDNADADDDDFILLPPVILKNLCARHWIRVNSATVRGNSSSEVVFISDTE